MPENWKSLLKILAWGGGYEIKKNQAIACSALLFCYKSVGFFNEAVHIIENFDPTGVPDKVLADFYILGASTWQNLSSYVYGSKELSEEYDARKVQYYNLALQHADPQSYEYAWISLELELCRSYSDSLATKARRSLIANFKINEHEQAVQYSILSSALASMGRLDESIYYRAISAILDIRSNTHETTSAKMLAECMYNQGDIKRASRYIHQALYDAEFYNSRLRMVEINTVLPVIENSKLNWMDRQRKFLYAFGGMVLLMLTVTAVLLVKIRRRNRKLSKTHAKLVENSRELQRTSRSLSELNAKLKESNDIKDQYIIHTLYGNSSFVNDVEEQVLFAVRKIMSRQYDDALALLHHIGIKQERERMFNAFDSAFLKLFPNFIGEFNKLFPDDSKISLEDNGKLPMEIRIFALMRLGIDNNIRIAEYLNLSVNTVYVYKTRIKSKSFVSKDDFDTMIMAIPKP